MCCVVHVFAGAQGSHPPADQRGLRQIRLQVSWETSASCAVSLCVFVCDSGYCLHLLRFLTGSYDRTCRVWDTVSGGELHTLQGHGNVVYAVAFNNPYG